MSNRDETIAAVAAEALRHVEWLRESGVREVERPAAAAPRARAVPTAAAAPVASAATAAPQGGAASSTRYAAPGTGAAAERGAAAAPPPAVSTGRNAPVVSTGRNADVASTGRNAAPAAYSLADKGCGSESLLAVRGEVGECTRCKLGSGRKRLVFGVGNPRAELMFVGEGPGADEDEQGEPFVGKAGQLLTKMIEAMGYARGDVYIANVVKCRPPGNRDPEPDEIAACEPFLKAQIAAVSPKVIVALGRFAVQTLLRDDTPISRLRGAWRTYEGVKLMPTFHPAYLLRNPPEKRKAWDDLQLVMKELGKTPPSR